VKATVEIGSKTASLVRSPVFYVSVALSAVAMSFCLLNLYQAGRDGRLLYDPIVLINVAIIWFVHFFDMAVAMPVMRQLRESPAETPSENTVVS
jgi:hypothetical protein